MMNTWYIDPVNGNDTNAGTQAAPWKNIQSVVTALNGLPPKLTTVPYWHRGTAGVWLWGTNSAGPVNPGDTVYLMNGAHGDLILGVYGQTIVNPAPVTFSAAPGCTPVISSIRVSGSNNWVFRGLKVQGLVDSGRWLVNIASDASDVVLDDLDVSSIDDASAWKQADWVAKARIGGVYTAGSRVSITGCTIRNCKGGAGLYGADVTFSDNTLDGLGGDFIGYSGKRIAITGNRLTNSMTLGNGDHLDFMQGRSGGGEDITIEGNICIRATRDLGVFAGICQGISAFNPEYQWKNVAVRRNRIFTSAGNGITYLNVVGLAIEGNDVIDDMTFADGYAPNVLLFVYVDKACSNVSVQRNLATAFRLPPASATVVLADNMLIDPSGKTLPNVTLA